MADRKEILEVAGHEVAISNPGKVFFPRTGHTKLDLVRYYLGVADGAMAGVEGRPMVLKRFVNGAEGEAFFQKRAPESRPAWIDTVELRFPSGRSAVEVVPRDAATLVWAVNLGCIDLNPHPVRAGDLEHPDELRVDLDPVPGVEWPQILQVALVARGVLDDFGLASWPKTSGSRGFHVYARIERRWDFAQVRQAAVALAREVERRAPDLATAKWWKEERHGVFVDYNQNAKDRTVASAYSVRPTPDARVSTPLSWDEVADCRPEAFTIDTVPERFARLGDPWQGMDDAAGSLDRCSAWPSGTRRPGCRMPRGRRTTTSRPGNHPGSSRRSAGRDRPDRGARRPGRRGIIRTAGSSGGGHPAAARRAAAASSPPAAAGPPCRSSRWPAPRPRTRPWPGWTAGRNGTPPCGPTWSPPTCWWTRCAGAAPPGPGSG